ncbi:YihD family protein [Corallincola platygyrae]|uniref:YihD family protein n=1 Tax=Corallincola platygyrae TaxID=1193278 RepID=A0ABW4XMD1_9GAMM
MNDHRISELLELLEPYWKKQGNLNLTELLAQIGEASGHQGGLETLTDDVVFYHLKMKASGEREMIPGIAKDCEDDFKTALLKARGIIKD